MGQDGGGSGALRLRANVDDSSRDRSPEFVIVIVFAVFVFVVKYCNSFMGRNGGMGQDGGVVAER